mmetsp:Transcript_117912/g.165762  ORF Transcript_117912/g.165762 Transcript_117912/m.165762 type:complete len:162 (+) Transcript_117912:713-1198(+)
MGSKVEAASKKRHPERSLKEVLDLVKRWREISDDMRRTSARDSGKFSLEEAAKKIGIPRKSLDDYLFVLRRARELKFDFDSNMEYRFGIVRAYVRKYYKGKKEGGKVGGDNVNMTPAELPCEDDAMPYAGKRSLKEDSEDMLSCSHSESSMGSKSKKIAKF